MNTGQFIQTLLTTIVGGIVGGLIVITTNWITAKGKRRQDIQEWYERTFITEGIDPLVAYYQYLVFGLFDKSNGYTLKVIQRDIPVEALGKVRVLLNDFVPLNIILFAHAHLAYTIGKNMLGEVATALQDAVEAFLDFRLELTKVVSNQVHDKHYIANTANLIARLEKVFQTLKDLEEQRLVEADEENESKLAVENIRKIQRNVKRRDVPHPKRRNPPYPRV